MNREQKRQIQETCSTVCELGFLVGAEVLTVIVFRWFYTIATENAATFARPEEAVWSFCLFGGAYAGCGYAFLRILIAEIPEKARSLIARPKQ